MKRKKTKLLIAFLLMLITSSNVYAENNCTSKTSQVLTNVKESNTNIRSSSMSSAIPINLNETYNGILPSYQGEVWYKFTLTKDGYIDSNILASLSTRYSVQLYDIKKECYVSYMTYYGDSISSVRVGLPRGTYYIKISNYDYNNTQENYQFSVSFKESQYWEKEFNDSMATADTVELNKTYNAMANSDNYDWFKFTLPSDGYIDFNMSKLESSKFDVEIKKVDDHLMDSFSTNYGTGYHKNRTGLPKGTYYVKIKSTEYEYWNTQYSFNIKFTSSNFWETECNDEFRSSDKISLNKTFYGMTDISDWWDYYNFDLTNNTTVSLKVSNSNSYKYDVYLYNQSENEITSFSTDYGNGYTNKKITLSKGRYYVVVGKYSYYDDKSQYSLSVNLPYTSLSTDKVYFDSTYVSGKTTKNAQVSVIVGNKTYKVTANSSGVYKVSIPKQKVGTIIKISSSKKGYRTKTISAKVIKRDILSLTINTVRKTHTSVSGKTLAGSTVSVKVNSKTYKTKANSSGYFKVSIPKQKPKTKITVTVSKTNYNSKSANTIVK